MGIATSSREEKLQQVIESEKYLNDIRDFDVLLESVLTEARRIVHADAGSIYVIENNNLKIRYAQNDSQQKKLPPGEKLPFKAFSFPINEQSMCGHCVVTKSIANESDVYNISPEKKYSFNTSSDRATGYKSKAIVAIPLINANGIVLGVLQIINPQDDDGNIIGFDDDSVLYLTHFATSATQALERTQLTREMVDRLAKLAAFRDPNETSKHVDRVRMYSVEIYDRWAFDHGISSEEKQKFRDALSLAAPLHDVGKVAISDIILKKPGILDDAERASMKGHTCLGGKLFDNSQSSFDEMAKDVALHHHERWDGNGYPGKIDTTKIEDEDFTLENLRNNNPLEAVEPMAGEEIPLAARIVAVADVYDALVSPRCYKKPWDRDAAKQEIMSQAGLQFDPEVVRAFFEIASKIDNITDSHKD